MTDRSHGEQPPSEDPLVLPTGAAGTWRITISASGRLARPPAEPVGQPTPEQPPVGQPPVGQPPVGQPGDEDRTVLGVRVPDWPVLNAAPLPPPAAAANASEAGDEGEEFVPPDPPLPRWTSDRVHRTGWVLVLLGPVLFLIVGPLGWDPTLRLVAGAVFVGGLVLLATRLPDESRRDDPDAGARV